MWRTLVIAPLLFVGCAPCDLCFGGGSRITRSTTFHLDDGVYIAEFRNACSVVGYRTRDDGTYLEEDFEVTDIYQTCSTVTRESPSPLTIADRDRAFEVANLLCLKLLRGVNPNSESTDGVFFPEDKAPNWYFPSLCTKVFAE